MRPPRPLLLRFGAAPGAIGAALGFLLGGGPAGLSMLHAGKPRPFPEVQQASAEQTLPPTVRLSVDKADLDEGDQEGDADVPFDEDLPELAEPLRIAPINASPVPSVEQQTSQPPETPLIADLGQPLADIQIEGNVSIPRYAILSKIGSRVGRETSQQQIEDDVHELQNTRYFFRVAPIIRGSAEGPILVFQVTERPMIRSVTFRGNKKIKTGELEAHTGLMRGHAFDVATNLECVERIKALYRDKGYRHAEVRLEQGSQPEDRDIVFAIDEGSKVRVWDIDFVGNESISSAILKTKLATKRVILWKIGGTYEPEIVANDVGTLTRYYNDLGYFDVDVRPEMKESDDKAWINVVFHINEGTRYRVRETILEGHNVLTQEQLFDDRKLEPGDFFNSRFLQKDVAHMKEQYDELGRLFSKVTPTPRFLEQPGWVDVVYQIDEDKPYRIGQVNIHIRGDHPHTREDVVRSQVNPFLKPGDMASGSNLRMANARLRGHQIWDRADPATINVEPAHAPDYLAPPELARGQSAPAAQADPVDSFLAEMQPAPWPRQGTQTAGFRPPESPTPRAAVGDTVQADPAPPGPLAQHGPAARSARGPRGAESSGHSTRTPRPNPAPARPAGAFEPTSESAPPPNPSAPLNNKTSALPSGRPTRSQASPLAFLAELRAGLTPDALFSQPESDDLEFRGQSPEDVYRGQSVDAYGNPIPQNYLQGVSPQGDPFGDAFNRPGEPGFVDVNIDVSEGRTGRLMFGVGVNSDAGVIGSFTFQEDNFDLLRPPRSWADIVNGQAWRGAGQSFRVEAMPGSEVSRYLVSWQDPYFLRSDYSFGVSGFYYNRFFSEWTEDRLGGRINIGRLLSRYWSISTALRLENVDIRSFNQAVAPQRLLDVRGDNFLSTVLVTLSHDTRDSAFLPTEGHLLETSYEQGFGDFNYPRVEAQGSQYFTLWERPDGLGKHILSVRGQIGWTGDNTPVFERFYAGGYSSFRGFAFRGVTPREAGFRVGGDWMTLGTVEYMAPITADDNIRAVAFTDFGTIEQDVSLDNFRVSAGVGLRLIIPAMGPAPIALDFAWPITSEPEDNERVFSFYVGFTR